MLDRILEKNESKMLILESENKTTLNFEAGNPFISDKGVKLKLKEGKKLEFPHPAGVLYSPKVLDQHVPDLVKTALHELSKLPNNPYMFNNLGLALLAQRKWKEAKRQFEKAIQIKKDFYSAKMNLARTFVNLEMCDDALAIYKELEKEHIGDTKILMNIAHICFVQKKLDESEKLLNRIISLDKNNAAAYNNRAVVQIIKGKSNNAIADLRKALSINTYFAAAENNLGVCYTIKGIPKKAIRHFLAVLSIDANCGNATQNLVLFFHKLKEYEKAITLLESYLKRNQFDISARELLAKSYLIIKKYDRCYQHLNLAFNIAKEKYKDELHYDFSHFYNNFGVMYHCRREFVRAKECYLKSKQESGQPSEILYQNITNLYFDMGKINLAKKELEEALERFPDSGDILFLYSKYYFRLGKIEETINALRKSIKKKPGLIVSYALLSFVYSEILFDYDLAIRTVEKGLSYDKRNPVLLNNLAYNYLMKNDIGKARIILDTVKDVERNVFLTATRGLLLLKEGNVQEGTSLYNRAAFFAQNNPVLCKEIGQKKNLELARFYYDRDRRADAIKYLKRLLTSKLRSSVYYAQGEKFADFVDSSRS